MAEQRHTAAFVVGAVLGGLAGAAAVMWTTPKSGAQLRADLAQAVEAVLFRVTEVGERGRQKLAAAGDLIPPSAPEPASAGPATATSPVGDVREPAPAAEPDAAGPDVFPPLVDFAPPGVDVEPPADSPRPAPPD